MVRLMQICCAAVENYATSVRRTGPAPSFSAELYPPASPRGADVAELMMLLILPLLLLCFTAPPGAPDAAAAAADADAHDAAHANADMITR